MAVVLKPVLGPPATTHFVCLSHMPHPFQVLQTPLMSWWVESGVLNGGDIQNMLWLGSPGQVWKPLIYGCAGPTNPIHEAPPRNLHGLKVGVSNPASGELPSCRFQFQPQSNTLEPANSITGRWIGAGLELKSAVWYSRSLPCWKTQHMLVMYVLKHGSWFKLVLSWSWAGANCSRPA